MRHILWLLFLQVCLHAQTAPQQFLISQSIAAGGSGSFLHSRSLTVDHTQVGGSGLTHFPAIVRATLGSSSVQNASCFDVIFTSDSGGTTKIPWEMETCNQSTGVLVAWVDLATVSILYFMCFTTTLVSAALRILDLSVQELYGQMLVI